MGGFQEQAKKAEGLEEELEKHKRDRLIKAEAIDEDGVKNQELYDRVMNLTRKSAVTSETAAAIREAGIRRTEMRKAADEAEKKRIRCQNCRPEQDRRQHEKAEKKRMGGDATAKIADRNRRGRKHIKPEKAEKKEDVAEACRGRGKIADRNRKKAAKIAEKKRIRDAKIADRNRLEIQPRKPRVIDPQWTRMA